MLIIIIIILLLIIIVSITNPQSSQRRVAKASLFLQIFEKLNNDKKFKKIEEILKQDDSENVGQMLAEEKAAFEEYLRFFDSIVFLQIPNCFSKDEADYLFTPYSDLLKKHLFVRRYIAELNYKNLEKILNSDSDKLLK